MLDLIRAERPGDAVVGEEVGPQPGRRAAVGSSTGSTGRATTRDGRPGWGTIIACEVEGEVVLGVVSSPRFGHRWWAVPR